MHAGHIAFFIVVSALKGSGPTVEIRLDHRSLESNHALPPEKDLVSVTDQKGKPFGEAVRDLNRWSIDTPENKYMFGTESIVHLYSTCEVGTPQTPVPPKRIGSA